MAHSPEPAETRDKLAEVLGAKPFNRLVESAQEVREKGRLRYWQEQLLQQAGPTGNALCDAEEFLRVFDGASLRALPPEPWDRGIFLTRIEKWPYGGFPLDKTPLEWMAAAWEIDRIREEISGEMERTVSKTGELAYQPEYLQYLSKALSIDRQVELFLFIRDNGNQLREQGFRPGFERAFPRCVPYLPARIPYKNCRLCWE